MAANLIGKLLVNAVNTGGTYVDFIVSNDNVAFICDGGSRRSTRNFHRSKVELKDDEKALKSITENSLLFANHLKRIQFTLSDGRAAFFQRNDYNDICTIKCRKVIESKEKVFEYICFTSGEDPCTGLAFMVKTLKNGNHRIVPCAGEIMNGPNATGIPTELKFIVSADFHVEKGAFDKKEAVQNQIAVDNLSAIMESAVRNIVYMGLMGMPFFSVLPNTRDTNAILSDALREAVKNVSNYYPIFKTRKGTIVNRNRIVYGTDDVTRLFPQDKAEPFLRERYWTEPCESGSREEQFLMDMRIPCYNRERFLRELFSKDNLDSCEKALQEQNDKWLREFYVFCSGDIEDKTIGRLVISGLRNIHSIRDRKGRMCLPTEIALLNNIKAVSRNSAVVKPEIISPSGKDDEYTDQLRRFFLNDLHIKEYSQKSEMEALASSMMNKKQKIDRAYVEKLRLLAEYDKAFPDETDFQSYAIFPYETSRGISRTTACDLVIGKPYIREGNLLAAATGRKQIWEGLKKLLDEDNLKIVLLFAEKNGAIGLPRIVRQSAKRHRDFLYKLSVPGRKGARDTDYDYTIPGLEDILKRRSLQLNRLVWKAILQESNSDDVLHAEYSADNRALVNRCDSSLVIILKERAWVPGGDGKLYMPENIAVTDISEDFPFDKTNSILNALQFGTGKKKKEKAIREMEKLATREGLRVISEEEYLEFLKWKNSLK